MAKRRDHGRRENRDPGGQGHACAPGGHRARPHGVAIMDFCKQYNAATESQIGTIVPVEITVFEDRSFTFVLKTPPAAVLLRQRAGIEKGASTPGKEEAGSVTEAQIAEIAAIKMPDLNANDLEAAKQQVRGTARSMGLKVV